MTRLSSVPLGAIVRVGGVKARLVRRSYGSAIVEVDCAPREFTTKKVGDDGEEREQTVKFKGTKRTETWALGAEVDVVETGS